MTVTASAALALLVLFSSQTFAEQTPRATQQNNPDTMILPSAHDQSPYDFNHMGAGSDKSDELGVPYYNQHGAKQLQRAQRFIQQECRTGKPHHRHQQG